MSGDLHYELDASEPVPYRCPTCSRVGWSRRRRPHCLGIEADLHEATAMTRIDERDAPSPSACPRLVLR